MGSFELQPSEVNGGDPLGCDGLPLDMPRDDYASGDTGSEWRLDWSSDERCKRSCLSSAVRERLEGYEMALARRSTADGPDGIFPTALVNVSQRPQYMKQLSTMMPSLLRSTFIWRIAPHVHDDLMMLGLDHMAVQAVRGHALLPAGHRCQSGWRSKACALS